MSASGGVGGYLGLMVVMDETSADLFSRHAAELTRFATGLVGPSEAADVVADAMARGNSPYLSKCLFVSAQVRHWQQLCALSRGANGLILK